MPSNQNQPAVPRQLFVVFLLLTLAVSSVGYLYYRSVKNQTRESRQNDLAAIADLKVRRIADWRKERGDDAWLIHDNIPFARQVQQWLQSPDTPENRREVLTWILSLRNRSGYANVLFVDLQGKVRISADQEDSNKYYDQALATRTFQSQKVLFTDLYRMESRKTIYLDLYVPLVVPQEKGSGVTGLIILRIDPYRFLFPFLQSWPTRSRTAETLMVRPEGGEVLYLNELRHRRNTALELRLPMDMPQLPAAMAAAGYEGNFEGTDYRGVPVLAATRKIPDSSWSVIAKVDAEEVYAPLRRQAWLVALTSVFLILTAGASLWAWWRQQLLRHYEREIARRELAENELRRSEARLREAQRIGRVGSWAVDLLKDTLHWSEETYRIFGRNPETFVPTRKAFLETIHRADLERVRAHSQAAIQSGKPYQIEHKIVLPDDDERVVVENAEIQLDGSGKPAAMVGTVQDITEQKKAEEALQASEERFRAIFEDAFIPMVLINREGLVMGSNHAMQDFCGFSAEEFKQKRIADLIHFEDQESSSRQVEDLLKGKFAHTTPLEQRFRHKDGHFLWGRSVASGVSDRHGVFQLAVIMVEDISERRRLEEQLLHSQKMEGIGRLAGGVAHDFNNLLTAILGYAALIESSLPPQDRLQEDAREIVKAANRAASLTQQLLAFARKQIIAPKVVNLNELVLNTDKMLRRLIGEDIEFVTLPGTDLWPVKVDPVQLEQVLINLAVNSRDAMPTGGRLIIETCNVFLDEDYALQHVEVTPGPYVMLAFTDTGVGMEEATRAHLFEPFFTTKERGKGTGLGLATCYGIIKQAGGYIWVYSEPGKGTTFKIYLPHAGGSATWPESPRIVTPDLSGHETILLVEDEPLVREMTAQVLRTQGYNVLVAGNGSEALSIAENLSSPIHLVITDVVMPQMSGRRLAETLHGNRPGIKVLYMSGYTENSIVHHGVLEEGIAFIAKPFTPGVLLKRVREELGKQPDSLEG
jgi:two-component system cell cycle sensor histidine kinase/response regulator CckA